MLYIYFNWTKCSLTVYQYVLSTLQPSKRVRRLAIGRLPWKLLRVCSLFLRRGKTITKRAGGVAIIRELARTGVHMADRNNYSLL